MSTSILGSAIGRRYGWRPSKPTMNAFFRPDGGAAEDQLPQLVDMRDKFPACYDQGQLGSCTGNGLAALVQHCIIKSGYMYQFTPSRLFIYFNERSIEGTVDSDAGAEIHDGIKAINQFGVCPEVEGDKTNPAWVWSYDDGPNKFKQTPPEQCYKDAILHQAVKYAQVNLDRSTVLNTLSEGRPIVFGFTVRQSFEDKEVLETGIMKVPGFAFLDPEIGGHCVVAVGYILNTPLGNDGVKDWAIIRNSWGTKIYNQNPHFGDMAGYFLMPLDKVMCDKHVSSDGWVIDVIGS
jgi:C1A family cysteine protease